MTAATPTREPGLGLDLGPLVLGANVFGWTADRDESYAVLDAWREAGGRAVDTADLYGSGASETILGDWMAVRGCRDEMVVCTKVGKEQSRRGLAPENVRAAAEESLRRLGVEHIDLYYAHADDPDADQAAYVQAFGDLVEAGKVRRLGASNFGAGRLRSAVELARSAGTEPFRASQDEWNLVEREVEQTLVPTLRELDVVEVPYYGLASGFLTGKYADGGPEVDSVRASRASAYLTRPGAADLLAALRDVAAEHGTSVAAVSLAWLRRQPTVAAPIASARTPEQLADLVASFDLDLSDATVSDLGSLVR